MNVDQVINFFADKTVSQIIFKVISVFVSVFYLIYALVVAKQVQIMDKTLKDKFNQLIFFVCSLQVTIALILIIFSLFLL